MFNAVKNGFALFLACLISGQGLVQAEGRLVSDIPPEELCSKAVAVFEKDSTKGGLCKVMGVMFGGLAGSCRKTTENCMENYKVRGSSCKFSETPVQMLSCQAPAVLVKQCFEDIEWVFSKINKTVSCGQLDTKAKSSRAKRKINNLNNAMSSCTLLKSLCPDYPLLND